MKLNKGFTLIELLIVIAILGILAAAIIVAINPGKRLTQSKIAGAFRFAKQIDYSLQFEGVGQWDFDDPVIPRKPATVRQTAIITAPLTGQSMTATILHTI